MTPYVEFCQPKFDDRGHLIEFFRNDDRDQWAQTTTIFAKKNSFRGMHMTLGSGTAKKIMCLAGTVIDFAIDCRPKSKTFGKVYVSKLDDQSFSMYVPRHYAHGVLALEDSIVVYASTGVYDPEKEVSINYKSTDVQEVVGKFPGLIISIRDRMSPVTLQEMRR